MDKHLKTKKHSKRQLAKQFSPGQAHFSTFRQPHFLPYIVEKICWLCRLEGSRDLWLQHPHDFGLLVQGVCLLCSDLVAILSCPT